MNISECSILMRAKTCHYCAGVFLGVLVLLLPLSSAAYDVNDQLSVGGILAGTTQYQIFSEDDGTNEELRGALVFQPELSFRPTEVDEIFIKLGFAGGNGLNGVSPFTVSSWGADLKDDVKDINGSGRNHLLVAWYKHNFIIREDSTLSVSGGIIDSSDFLDENAYIGDEYTQFMNAVFYARRLLPAYDIGAAIKWDIGSFGVSAVVMEISENENGRDYTFFGTQFAVKTTNQFGEGTYRLTITQTTKDFDDPQAQQQERLVAVGLSIDQQFSEVLGGFLKIGAQDNKAAVSYDRYLIAGIDISGKLWGRSQDNMGIGYAYLDGGNLNIDRSQIVEAYMRFVLRDNFSLTVDVQYIDDDHVGGGGPEGFVPGLRFVATF